MARSTLVVGTLVVASAVACASGPRPTVATRLLPSKPQQAEPSPDVLSQAVVRVQDRWLLLHLSRPEVTRPGQPLVLYITGDGGWGGKDLDTWEHLRAWGVAAAGFSAPDYLDRLRGGAESLPPHALARDLARIATAGRTALGLSPTSQLVLVGVSRGADLVVVAAAEPALRASVAGVLAVALTDEEEYVRRRPHRLFHKAGADPAAREPLEMVRPYDSLAQVVAPVCLIQSTNDNYVPAARARQQFGPESTTRRFVALESGNHSFSDARDQLYETMRSSFSWLQRVAPPDTAYTRSNR